VAQHRTRLGACDVLAANPHNGVLLAGHSGGTVTMWTPNITTPVVKMLCHHGPVKAAAVDPRGLYMVTSGIDGQARARGLSSSLSLCFPSFCFLCACRCSDGRAGRRRRNTRCTARPRIIL